MIPNPVIECDGPECEATHHLGASTHDLILSARKQGWLIAPDGNNFVCLCPEHRPGAAR